MSIVADTDIVQMFKVTGKQSRPMVFAELFKRDENVRAVLEQPQNLYLWLDTLLDIQQEFEIRESVLEDRVKQQGAINHSTALESSIVALTKTRNNLRRVKSRVAQVRDLIANEDTVYPAAKSVESWRKRYFYIYKLYQNLLVNYAELKNQQIKQVIETNFVYKSSKGADKTRINMLEQQVTGLTNRLERQTAHATKMDRQYNVYKKMLSLMAGWFLENHPDHYLLEHTKGVYLWQSEDGKHWLENKLDYPENVIAFLGYVNGIRKEMDK